MYNCTFIGPKAAKYWVPPGPLQTCLSNTCTKYKDPTGHYKIHRSVLHTVCNGIRLVIRLKPPLPGPLICRHLPISDHSSQPLHRLWFVCLTTCLLYVRVNSYGHFKGGDGDWTHETKRLLIHFIEVGIFFASHNIHWHIVWDGLTFGVAVNLQLTGIPYGAAGRVWSRDQGLE